MDYENEQTLSSALADHAGETKPTLTGSDFKQSTLTITIVKAEKTPKEWTAPVKVTFKPAVMSTRDGQKVEIDIWGVNKGNSKALGERFGDSLSRWAGKRVTLGKIPRTNPKTGKAVVGLVVMM